MDAIITTALFKTEKDTLSAIKTIQGNGFKVTEVHSPIPSNAINKALGREKSKIGWFTLAGGITGFVSGFALAIFTATRWDLIVSGKPIVSWIPFFIIAFEFTILFAVLGNVLGIITQVGLPEMDYEKNYAPECSGALYGIEVASSPRDLDTVKDLLHNSGSLKDRGKQK